jgi:DNA-binding NarL/FixJ family response regulator
MRTPALRLLEAPPELTPREREIAQLAARGHPSKAIAAQLVISVRTVDNALHEVYSKLSINRRADLAPILGQPTTHPSNTKT